MWTGISECAILILQGVGPLSEILCTPVRVRIRISLWWDFLGVLVLFAASPVILMYVCTELLFVICAALNWHVAILKHSYHLPIRLFQHISCISFVYIWWPFFLAIYLWYQVFIVTLPGGRCRISPPRFLAKCCKRQLNQVSFIFAVF